MKSLVSGLITIILCFIHTGLLACAQCQPAVKASVYNQDFTATLFVLLLPIAILLMIGLGIYFSDSVLAILNRDKNK